MRRYPQAHYLVANRVCPDSIVKQLAEGGIGMENISVYQLPLDAFENTSVILCKSEGSMG